MPIVNTQIIETINITKNGQYDVAKYTTAKVNVSGGGSAVIEELNVTPSTSAQTIDAPAGIDGYSPINVSAVTSNIDSNIKAENIKDGVNILGVTGTYSGGSSTGFKINSEGVLDTNRYTKLVDFSKVKSVSDMALAYAYSNYYSKNKLLFGKKPNVDLSSLLELSGERACLGAFSLNSRFNQGKHHGLGNVNIGNLKTISGDNACREMFAASDFLSFNISSLETISGYYSCESMFRNAELVYFDPEPVESDSSGDDSDSSDLDNFNLDNFDYNSWNIDGLGISFESLTKVSGQYACQNMFNGFRVIDNNYRKVPGSYISFPVLNSITYGAFMNAFEGSYVSKVSFPSVNALHQNECFKYAFRNSGQMMGSGHVYTAYPTIAEFPVLKAITGHRVFEGLYEDAWLDSIEFPALETISGQYVFKNAFKNLNYGNNDYFIPVDIYFPALKTAHTSTFVGLFDNTRGITLHFPSNLDPQTGSTVISGLDDYPYFGGTDIQILYDL